MVLWLANISRNKQPEVFIDLAERSLEWEGWRFVLAGGTENRRYWRELASLAERLDNLEMIGAVAFERTGELFSRAAFFVNTSQVEGLPNSFIQAWMHETPVLSLFHDPNGWMSANGIGLCAQGDPDRFFRMGKELLQGRETREKMGRAAQRFARSVFGAQEIIDQYIRIFSGPDRSPATPKSEDIS